MGKRSKRIEQQGEKFHHRAGYFVFFSSQRWAVLELNVELDVREPALQLSPPGRMFRIFDFLYFSVGVILFLRASGGDPACCLSV